MEPLQLHIAASAYFAWRQRFWDKVWKTETCWIWQGALSKAGYGTFNLGPRRAGYVLAHRAAYEQLVGPIPNDLQLDHLCRQPACVNPAHLEPVTRSVNARRGFEAVTGGHCRRGHPLTPENVYWRKDRPGRWACRACNRECQRARYQAKRGQA